MNKFAPAWKLLEKLYPRPERVRHVKFSEYQSFRERVMNQGYDFVSQIVASLYHGDIYILRNAFPEDWMAELKRKVFAYGQATPSSFHKMVEGTPDFHRVIDLETGKKYSFPVCKHSAFFYRWADPLKLFPPVYERWRVIKILMGLEPDAYEMNTPKDGVVDRIQVAQYPSKIGFLETHSDPWLHQRLFFSGYMTKRGVDYVGGGFYLVGPGDKVVEVEDDINVGDIGIGYATVYHGVAPCNRDYDTDWNSPAGRWFLSMYSNASDEVKNRHTGKPAKLDLKGVRP